MNYDSHLTSLSICVRAWLSLKNVFHLLLGSSLNGWSDSSLSNEPGVTNISSRK